MTSDLTELVAVLTCTLFAGAAVYITAVEHPARLACGTEVALAQWAPSYKRATVMQASLAAIAALSGLIRGFQGGGPIWIWAASIILAVIPFTLIVIRPTNNRLLGPQRDGIAAETRQLLESWGHLHAVRSILGVVASILFIWAAVRP